VLESYAGIYHVKHRATECLWNNPVVVQEKIDGSQISFGIVSPSEGAEPRLCIRSKGAEIQPDGPEKLFAAGVRTIRGLESRLLPGTIYRGEYLSKPKHNALSYDRIPADNIILFDVEFLPGWFMVPNALKAEATRLGLESVPTLYLGPMDLAGFLAGDWFNTMSVLGGQNIEGVVVKNYAEMDPNSKRYPLMAKWVSAAFREVHAAEWKSANPNKNDIVAALVGALMTPARYQKAVIHLAERGELVNAPQDIGKLMVEVRADVERECGAEIAKKLVEWAMPQILRGVAGGVPAWYKALLVKDSAFVIGPGGQV
jgi:hypothetical protein